MNQRADFIIPECYIDTNLVETLACPGGCNHQKGCNQVAKVMKEKFADRFAVGIIDADKRRPAYLSEFNEIASSEHIKLLRHKSRLHFIILVHPAADGFILASAAAADVDLSDYGLPSTLKEFTAETKNVLSNKDTRFKQLFKTMCRVGEFKLLSKILHCFMSKLYKVSDNELASIFQS
ncbi:MAG: hypothetical protein K2M10_00375 [Muribaculaceae bacterium]|nr:hypothetical protein [Muribaculaceae bacterium]MDE6298087.1 hypothetical protein [Muribaculaceae bacterium]